MDRQIKFPSILTDLIERKAPPHTRKKICGDIGISTSLLSQYERDKSVPSFENLLKLANYFDVSIDYLVYGENSRTLGTDNPSVVDATYKFIDEKLELLSTHAEKRHWFLSKLSNAVIARLDRTVDRIIGSRKADLIGLGLPGFLDDQSVLELERHARKVDIFTTDFSYDVFINEEGAVVPGKFFHIVAENIRDRGTRYRFLLPRGGDWTKHIEGFFSLLRSAAGERAIELCECVVADRTLISGIGICDLDLDSLAKASELLYAQIEDHISEASIAYIIPPTTLLHGDLLVAGKYVPFAKELFDEAWTDGRRTARKGKRRAQQSAN